MTTFPVVSRGHAKRPPPSDPENKNNNLGKSAPSSASDPARLSIPSSSRLPWRRRQRVLHHGRVTVTWRTRGRPRVRVEPAASRSIAHARDAPRGEKIEKRKKPDRSGYRRRAPAPGPRRDAPLTSAKTNMRAEMWKGMANKTSPPDYDDEQYYCNNILPSTTRLQLRDNIVDVVIITTHFLIIRKQSVQHPPGLLKSPPSSPQSSIQSFSRVIIQYYWNIVVKCVMYWSAFA